jgi:hypothetical protein
VTLLGGYLNANQRVKTRGAVKIDQRTLAQIRGTDVGHDALEADYTCRTSGVVSDMDADVALAVWQTLTESLRRFAK